MPFGHFFQSSNRNFHTLNNCESNLKKQHLYQAGLRALTPDIGGYPHSR